MTESVARSVFNNTDEDSSVVSGKRRRATVEGSVMGCRVESAVVGTEEVPAAGTAKANSKRSRVHSASEDKAETLKPRASTRTRRSLPNSSIPKAKNSPEKMAEETTVEVSGPSTRPRWTAAPFLPTLNLSLFETPLPHPVSCTSSAKEGASLSKKKQINIIRDFFHVSAVHPPRVAIILSLSEKSQKPDSVSLGVIMGFERSGLMMELAMRRLIASGDDGDGAQQPLDENELSRLCFDGVVSGNGSENACPLKMVKENESNLDDISAEDEAEHLSRLQASAIQALHNVLSKPNPTLPPFDQTTMVPASKRRVSNQPITSNYSIPHIRGIHLPSLLVSRNPHVCTAVHVDENTDPDDSEWSRSLAFLVPSTAAAASAFTNNATPHWKSLCKYLHSTNAPVSSLSTKKRAPSKTALPSVFVVPKRQPRKAPLVRRFPSARPRSLSPSGTPSSPITWSPSPPPPPRVYKRGERAREAEEVWERHAGMRALYARKEFLRAGMYSGDLNRDVVVTVAEEDADTVAEPEDTLISEMTSRPFKFSMPMYYGETILETEEDFELPFDLHRFVKVVGSGELAPPPQLWALEGKRKPPQYVRIKKNIFVDRRPRKPALETPICFCVVPADRGPACGADCLNRLMQFECTPGKCPAGDACSNQMFQRGVQTEDLEVCLTNGRGFGIRTNAAISKNRLVMEYCGEIISQETCLERMDTLYAGTQHYYFLNYDRGEVIDGGRKGSLARFVNHSCDPNCRIEKWSVNGEYHVGLFADKEIPPSSELTYDYKFEAFGPMRKCLCGGRKCRGFLGRNGRGGDGLSDIKALKLASYEILDPEQLKAEAGEKVYQAFAFLRRRVSPVRGTLPYIVQVLTGNPFDSGVNIAYFGGCTPRETLLSLFREVVADSAVRGGPLLGRCLRQMWKEELNEMERREEGEVLGAPVFLARNQQAMREVGSGIRRQKIRRQTQEVGDVFGRLYARMVERLEKTRAVLVARAVRRRRGCDAVFEELVAMRKKVEEDMVAQDVELEKEETLPITVLNRNGVKKRSGAATCGQDMKDNEEGRKKEVGKATPTRTGRRRVSERSAAVDEKENS